MTLRYMKATDRGIFKKETGTLCLLELFTIGLLGYDFLIAVLFINHINRGVAVTHGMPTLMDTRFPFKE
jgi:hypothetical protein